IASFDRAISIKPLAESWCGRANALYSIGKWDAALAGYDEALSLNSSYIEAMFGKVLCFIARTDHAQAANICREILSIEPRHLPPRWISVLGVIPGTPLSSAELDAGREAFAVGLDDLADCVSDGLEAPRAVQQMVPFLLAYCEQNNVELFARYG